MPLVRYRLPDGTLSSETDFPTITAARDRAADIDSEQRRGIFVDPRRGQTPLHEWIDTWRDAHDVSAGTWAKYDSHLRNHILPAFGQMSMVDIKRIQIKAWVKTLRRRLAEPTVADIVSLLSAILGEAVDEGLTGANPCRKLRINTEGRPERHAATARQLLQITHHCGPSDALLITTAAYTGMRWGELAGLRWRNIDLIARVITIDPQTGALHEVHGRLELGPPKTAASVRTVHLPPFLATLLAAHQDRCPHDHVFTGSTGALLRRANFRRRIWRPALVRAGLLG